VLYTRNEIYFGVTCHDSSGNGAVATQLRRDVTQELDDYFRSIHWARRETLSSPTSRRGRPRTEIPDGMASGRPKHGLREMAGRRPLPYPLPR
jgi:hypothetical protein